MARYIVRRFAFGLLAVIGATVVVFALSRASGDPRYLFVGTGGMGLTQEQWDALGREMRLDKPVVVQYVLWVGDIARGDFGNSITTQRPVLKVIRDRVGTTARLALAAWLFGTVVGIPLGVFSATHRGQFMDYVGRTFALLGQSLPVFWTGIMFIIIFAVKLEWLPSGGRGEGFAIRNFVLPAIALGWLPAAGYLRLTRSAMLEVLDSEFIKFARAKGVAEFKVLWKHAFRNAIIIPLTYSALLLIGFITGTVVAETVFTLPGIGRLAVDAIWGNDFPVISTLVLVFSVVYVVVVLFLDIVYALVDPRIRYT
ncbi:MAG: ABC transporter permease [Chloroflexota bacterium]|nr:ABC transporter permease [Chloroflexota bacterium]